MYLLFILYTVEASIKVIEPRDLKDKYYNEIESSLGNFGNPPYNSHIFGNLWYSREQNGCLPLEISRVDEDSSNLIVMVDRGECAFVIKVKNAQDVGAKAVIIANNNQQKIKNIIMSDNGMGGNLFIPALLISKDDGLNLKNFIPYPGVTLRLGFEMPESPEQIRLTLIFSSAQNHTQNFMKMFEKIGKHLNQKNTYLEVHYAIIKCIYCEFKDFKNEEVDCLGGGRYCAPDPDGNNGPLTGRDVVEEDLRQICVFEMVKNEKMVYESYFKYLKEFGSECRGEKFNKKCSENAMKTAGIDVSRIRECYSGSFTEIGKGETLSKNAKLESEAEFWLSYGHSYYPAVVINDKVYRGDMEVSALKTGICAGYYSGTEPDFCKKTHKEESEVTEGYSVSTVVIALVLFFGLLLALLLGYRYYARKELHNDMRVQVNSAVNQYFALSETSSFKKK